MIIRPQAVRAPHWIQELPNPGAFFMSTAVLIDGGFYLHRVRRLCGAQDPQPAAQALFRMCLDHLSRQGRDRDQLYRIFYYDAPPLSRKTQNPVSGKGVDFSQTAVARWRREFLAEMKKLRKVAVRLGDLAESTATWVLRSGVLPRLLKREITIDDLTPEDVKYDVRQKGVDMRIGIDISALALKRQVDQIILVAGDSDFVPAAKLARREGIDFILDPLWAGIRADLHEHIDGLPTVLPKPQHTAAAD